VYGDRSDVLGPRHLRDLPGAYGVLWTPADVRPRTRPAWPLLSGLHGQDRTRHRGRHAARPSVPETTAFLTGPASFGSISIC